MNDEGGGGQDDFLVPISALEHFSYCPRQCALIHVEQTFDENVFTIRGRLSHERVDSGVTTVPRGVRQVRSVPLWSDEHGLIGKADLVEFRKDGPVPVEYKVGRVTGGHARLQLCAQALCLEEMLRVPVPAGALYSHATKRRVAVEIDLELRRRTLAAVAEVRGLLIEQQLPPPVNDSRCTDCSLINACLPAIVGGASRVRGYQGSLFRPASAGHVAGWFDV